MSSRLLNPKTIHREFSGLPGALGIIFGLPLVVILLHLLTNENYSIKGFNLDWEAVKKQLPNSKDQLWALCFDAQCWKVYLIWFVSTTFFDLILPGKHKKGVQLRDGTHLAYNINGKSVSSAFVAVLIARLFLSPTYFVPELQFVYDHQLQLILVTVIFSFLLSVFVYIASFIPLTSANGVGTKERILSVNGNTGNPIYDFFIGRELNPRIGSWDIKLFCELRPGMLLWLAIDLACIHNQYHKYGSVSDSIVLVTALQAFYVFDGVLNEEGCLSMIDITTDGFGFMLSFGDLAWVPWTYSLQARYLSNPQNAVHLGYIRIAAIVLLMGVGYYIFSASNNQKSAFKQGKLDHMKSIKTKTGSKLLCDGWWAMSQHINYLGDWMIAWRRCLPTGFQTPVTYFYVIYFGTLLLHRQMRDDAKCSDKYGEQWEEYKRLVPYKIIPYVY